MNKKIHQKKAYSYIRFSSLMQSRGDSLRRQREATDKWANDNDFIIVDNLEDLGLSAYSGRNKANGALGVFLEKIEEGLIEKGSYLIVESLDRLSRQQIILALSQFLQIISSGINVVTLMDNRIYSEQSINDIGNLMYSLMIMHRAHEESHVKSQRISASWDNKIKNAKVKVVTASAPAWFKFNEATDNFELIPDRAEIIKDIFEKSISGWGKRTIANYLTKAKVPTWGKGKIWHESYINKILDNKATYGIYRAKRNEQEEEVENYFPAVVSKSTFYQSQSAIKSRTQNGGRKGKGFGNLFTHLCRCAECGSSMRYLNKGKPPKGGKYLKCSTARAGGPCNALKNWRYDDIEQALLLHLAKKVDWYSFINNSQNAVQELETKRVVLHSEHIELENALANYEQMLIKLDQAAASRITKKYNELASRNESILKELEELDIQIVETDKSGKKNIDIELNASLLKLHTAKDPDEIYNFRLRINKILKEAISAIWFSAKNEMIMYRMKDNSFHGFSVSIEHLESVAKTAKMDASLRLMKQLELEMKELIEEIRLLDEEEAALFIKAESLGMKDKLLTMI